MDAVIVATAAEMSLSAPAANVVTVIKVDDLVREFIELFDATVLSDLISDGSTSRSAVAPDHISGGGVSALASA